MKASDLTNSERLIARDRKDAAASALNAFSVTVEAQQPAVNTRLTRLLTGACNREDPLPPG